MVLADRLSTLKGHYGQLLDEISSDRGMASLEFITGSKQYQDLEKMNQILLRKVNKDRIQKTKDQQTQAEGSPPKHSP